MASFLLQFSKRKTKIATNFSLSEFSGKFLFFPNTFLNKNSEWNDLFVNILSSRIIVNNETSNDLFCCMISTTEMNFKKKKKKIHQSNKCIKKNLLVCKKTR